jgi:hypothetical protein
VLSRGRGRHAPGLVGAAPLLLLLATGCPPRAPAPLPPRAERGELAIEAVPDPVYVAPLFSLAGELYQLHFHLNLRNTGERALRVRRLQLVARGRGAELSLLSLEEALLAGRLRAAPVVVVRDRQTLAAAARLRGLLERPRGSTTIAAGESVSLEQVALLRADELPEQVLCRVQIDSPYSGGSARLRSPHAGLAEHPLRVVRFAQRTSLRLPFAGRWWVMAGHRVGEDHAAAALGSQRFAYDLGVLGADASTHRGDARRNESYHASGRPVLAAVDGEVVALHDGVPENEPAGSRPSWRDVLREPADLAGNFVVLRHAGEEHSAYLHLKPGLKLALGARVRAGAVVGACGNSGYSLESHLHFQLQDGPDPLRAAGLPARFGDFTLHLGHLRLHVPAARPRPLPVGLVVEPDSGPRAADGAAGRPNSGPRVEDAAAGRPNSPAVRVAGGASASRPAGS